MMSHNLQTHSFIGQNSKLQFLDSNGDVSGLDVSAPAITLPGNIFQAPFDSRNTAFGREAFWALLLLKPTVVVVAAATAGSDDTSSDTTDQSDR